MFNDIQNQVMDGSLLGDATIWINFAKKYNCKFQKTQSTLDKNGIDKMRYMEWHHDVFQDMSSSVKAGSVKGPGGRKYGRYTFSTKMLPCFNVIEARWYKVELEGHHVKRTKIVPQDINVTPLSLCVWYMDDGYNCQKDANITLCTNGFTVGECDFLRDKLREIGIIHTAIQYDRGKPTIFVGRKSYFDFIDMIKPHIQWDCFKYKTDTSGYIKETQVGEKHSQATMKEDQIREMFDLNAKGWQNKEIAEKFNVSTAQVALVLNGKRWKHLGLSEGRILSKKCKPHLSQQQIDEAITLRASGLTCGEIGKKMDVNGSTISRLIKRHVA